MEVDSISTSYVPVQITESSSAASNPPPVEQPAESSVSQSTIDIIA